MAEEAGAGIAGPLQGVRVVEVANLMSGTIGQILADLGADVVRVETCAGDPSRRSPPFVDGDALMHLHVNRGKRSVALDLRSAAGKAAFLRLASTADAVVDALRPGMLGNLGLGADALQRTNPRLVLVTCSGFGSDGPYRHIPTHGTAYDAWAGAFEPATDEDGALAMPAFTPVGIGVGPVYGALALVAAVLEARSGGRPRAVDVSYAHAALAANWYAAESARLLGAGQAVGTASLSGAVRHQCYRTRDDATVLLMATDKKHWEAFCAAAGRADLFDRWPGDDIGDEATGNTALKAALVELFAGHTRSEWITLASEAHLALVPVNTPATVWDDPHFVATSHSVRPTGPGSVQTPAPIRYGPSRSRPAPRLGEHTDELLGPA